MVELPAVPHNASAAQWHRSETEYGSQSTAQAFVYDVTLDEIRRRTAQFEAFGDEWNPVQALAEEDLAYRMLYSDLDDEQQRILDQLVRAGVLSDPR